MYGPMSRQENTKFVAVLIIYKSKDGNLENGRLIAWAQQSHAPNQEDARSQEEIARNRMQEVKKYASMRQQWTMQKLWTARMTRKPRKPRNDVTPFLSIRDRDLRAVKLNTAFTNISFDPLTPILVNTIVDGGIVLAKLENDELLLESRIDPCLFTS